MLLRTLCGLVVAGLALPSAPHAQEVVKIGLVAPLSGFAAGFGQELQAGVKAALERIKDINGRRVELIVGDDQCDPAKAVGEFERLAREKPVAVLGLPCSFSALATLKLAQQYGILMLPVASSPELTRRDVKEVLRPFGRTDRLARMTADVLKSRFAGKKIAWLGSERSPFTPFFQADAAAHKLDLTSRLGDGALNPQILDSLTGYDVVLVSRFLDAKSLADLAEKTSRSTIVLVRETIRPLDVAPLRNAPNVAVIANPEPGAAADLMKESGPAGYFPYGYASMEIVAKLAARTRDLAPDKLAYAAREADIPTMLGPLRFDGAGDVQGWRHWLWQRTGSTAVPLAMVDVCKAPNCKDFSQCPPNCPTP
ncbi:MAG: ABC transporter substrate-binding protein [Proteobacteria bacterium]|nr:ABC transporter substrate-binding protein [Pseudomonadota bacterium]